MQRDEKCFHVNGGDVCADGWTCDDCGEFFPNGTVVEGEDPGSDANAQWEAKIAQDAEDFYGKRVRLLHDVDRYPHFVAAKGSTGIVTEATAEMFAVQMDDTLPGSEEWNNEIHWYPQNLDDPRRDVEVIA